MNSPVRPNVLGMSPYSPGKPIDEVKRELGLTEVVKLASNENPLGPSPKAIEAVQKAAATMNIYPDASGHNLIQAISARFDIPANQIILGNGSDELIHMLGLVLIDSTEDEVIVGDPSFVRYDAAAQLAPCKLIKVPLDSEDKHDIPAMISAITQNTRIVFIANPNNPTGTVVTKQEIDKLLIALPEQAVLILDEAYYEFASHLSDFPSSTDYVRAGRRVIGLRTFSKTYGLAGIRLGFGFASPEVIDGINRAREPFNVNALAQAAGIAALSDENHLQRTIENNREGVRVISEAFRRVGAQPRETFANFVFADLGQPAKPVFEALLKKGVIVRSGHVLGKPNALRVSVGTAEENAKFVEAFESVMKETAVR